MAVLTGTTTEYLISDSPHG